VAAFEKYGFRDMRISERHRIYGFGCPAVDIDFLLIEYSKKIPVGVCDLKHYRAYGHVDTSHASYQAISTLAGDLPFWIAYYWPDTWGYVIEPINEAALKIFGTMRAMSERAYVKKYLYKKLRGTALPAHVEALLNRNMPPVALKKEISAA